MDSSIPDAWRSLSALQRDVLIVLAQDGPATGAAVNRALDRDYERRGPVHDTLQKLRAKGYVETEPADDPGEAKTNELTDAGRDLLREVGSVWHEVSVAVAP